MKKLFFSMLLLPGTITVFAQKSVVNTAAAIGSTMSSMPARLSMTPTTTRQTQGVTFGEKVSQGMQAAGAANVRTGNRLYKCDYCGELFETDEQMLDHQVDCKKAHPNAKNISEKGLKRQEAADGGGRTYTGGRKNEW
ncbi:MAG: hypothetical protein J7599_22570 [Niabella sp.]|nr:hypothetical protein [Niabella sp.]